MGMCVQARRVAFIVDNSNYVKEVEVSSPEMRIWWWGHVEAWGVQQWTPRLPSVPALAACRPPPLPAPVLYKWLTQYVSQ